MMKKLLIAVFWLIWGGMAYAGWFGPDLESVGLRCENLENPLGVDSERPRLSWRIEERGQKTEVGGRKSDVRGVRQTGYRVLVATSETLLKDGEADLWDSGKVASDQSLHVEYRGKPLESRRQCFWKVKVWVAKDDARGLKLETGNSKFEIKGKATGFSETACWTMGLMDAASWRGKWIGAEAAGRTKRHGAVYLRRDISIEKPVKKATVFFCGLGFSELSIDGRKVGDYVIGPGFTDYDKRVQYLVFDVTERVKAGGSRRLDVVLADGWYALEKDPWVHRLETKPYVDKPKLLLDLYVEYEDGSGAVFASDENWKWSEGEITKSWIAQEDVDLRKGGEAGRSWRPVAVVKGPRGRLVCQKEPCNRIVEKVSPVRLSYDEKTKTAVWDMGREINGWVRLAAAGSRGTVLNITTVAPAMTKRTSRFVLAGTGGEEVYEPRFFHSGFRNIEVSGFEKAPVIGDLSGCVVSSMYVPSGGFKCSDESVTALNEAVRRTVVNYTTFLPNDPVREWKAWVQDIENMFWSSVYLFDSKRMYERWQYDLLDGQAADGNCPNVAPGPVFDSYNSPWWGGCVVWLPWEYYMYYGDDSLLRRSYPAMKRYVDYLGRAGADGLQDWGLLDWLPVEETPRAIINTPAYYHYALIVSRTARMMGESGEAEKYEQLAGRIKDKFNRKFLDAATGIYGQRGWAVRCGKWRPPKPLDQLHEIWWQGDRPCTQAGQVLPLALGLVPKENVKAVEGALLKEIAAHRNLLSTGFVSTPYLLKIIADLDPECGWKMASSKEFPSWYYMTFGKGSDVMKETWAGGLALMPSLGGNIAAWQVESPGGIRPDPSGPGFRKFIIKPAIAASVTWVECWYESGYGRIVSNWKRSGGRLTMEIVVPPNTSATVYVPAGNVSAVTESGKSVAKAKGVKFLRMENGSAVFEVGSGSYEFVN